MQWTGQLEGIIPGNVPDNFLSVFLPLLHIIVIHKLLIADGYSKDIRRKHFASNCFKIIFHYGNQLICNVLQRVLVIDDSQVFLKEVP